MLQIISNSNETSTGPELVQNGNFSELGSNVVLNPDFTDGGSELVVNGDFATDSSWDGDAIISFGQLIKTGLGLAYQDSVINSGVSYKIIVDVANLNGVTEVYVGGNQYSLAEGVQTIYAIGGSTNAYIGINNGFTTTGTVINSISVKELGGDWTPQAGWTFGDGVANVDSSVAGTTNLTSTENTLIPARTYKVEYYVNSAAGAGVRASAGGVTLGSYSTATGLRTFTMVASVSTGFAITASGSGTTAQITNISVQELDPNDYWTLGTGWGIEDNKAISIVTGSSSYLSQYSILESGKTYVVGFDVVDYTDGNVKSTVSGSEGEARSAAGTYTDILLATGSTLSIKSQSGTFDGSVSAVSGKLVGSYSDQSIYVTAADVQTIPQASVYYLVELTSMGSKNSLYFLPSSVVANNGRYTKLNFTVISKDATPTPASGIISFYDSVGGFDTYPMGFYEFKIYEQTSSTNLDPLLATGLLEKGFAFVRDFSGNMQELTDGYKEYNPTLTQYVYSK